MAQHLTPFTIIHFPYSPAGLIVPCSDEPVGLVTQHLDLLIVGRTGLLKLLVLLQQGLHTVHRGLWREEGGGGGGGAERQGIKVCLKYMYMYITMWCTFTFTCYITSAYLNWYNLYKNYSNLCTPLEYVMFSLLLCVFLCTCIDKSDSS